MNYRSIKDLNEDIKAFILKLPDDLDLIVGVPRSGFMVASLIALYLHRPLTDVEGLCERRVLQSGQRFDKGFNFDECKKVLIVDDTVLKGHQMRIVKSAIERADLPYEIYYAAVYVTSKCYRDVDFWYKVLEPPRFFEWHIWSSDMLKRSCIDLDGVLCRDPSEEENDDGDNYKYFITNVEPLLRPSVEIGWIVSCRLEKYRDLTGKWLEKHGIRYKNLVLMNLPDKKTRVALGAYAVYKAKVYKSTESVLFIESSLKQAQEISKITGKDVLCIENNQLINDQALAKLAEETSAKDQALARLAQESSAKDQALAKLAQESSAKDRALQDYYRAKEAADKVRDSFSYQLGHTFTQAIRSPGRDTLLLPYRLLQLAQLGLKKLARSSRRRWGRAGRKTKVHIENRVNTVDKVLAGTVSDMFIGQGIQVASQYIGELEVSSTEKANLYEYLADLGLTHDPKEAAPLLLQAFELDPTYARGKRLARLGFDNGIISQPATIIARISRMPKWQSAVDALLAERIADWNHIREDLPVIPPRQPVPVFTRRERTAMMVLFCSRPYHSNGYAIRSHGLLSGLKKTSWEVISCTRPGYPWDVEHPTPPDQSEFGDVGGIIYRYLKGLDHREMGVNEYFDESAKIIEAVARTTRPAVIHAASNHLTALPALIAARRVGLPFIYEVRGLWEVTEASTRTGWSDTELFQLRRSLESLIAREADCVITITSGLRDELVSRGVREENIRIVPNCVDAKRFKPLPPDEDLHRRLGLSDAPTIGYVGSLVAYEGLDDLIRAAVILKERSVRFNLLLVGDGRVLNELRELIKQSDLEQEVIVTGRVPHQEVEQYYSLIDIAAFPRKPLPVCEMVSPLKPLEAMAMGKTVVASSVNAMKEIVIDGETGLLFEKGDVHDLAEKLINVVGDKSLAVRLSTNALRWVNEQRSWDNAAGTIAATYEDVVSKKGAQPALSPVHADKHAVPPKSLRLAIYADANLNIIDGSAIWTASLVEALAGLERANVFLFLKSKEKRGLLTEPLRKFSNVTIVEPTETDRLVGGSLTPDAALDKIEGMDSPLSFDAIFLRGFTLCEKASLRSRFYSRLFTYIVDIPRKSEELTPSILQKLDEIAEASKYILCQTEELRSHLEKHVPSAEGRTVILPPMVPVPKLTEEPSNGTRKTIKRICYAGKFDPLWGTIEMFDAFASLRASHPEVELHIFGDKIHNPPEIPDFQKTVLSYLNHTQGVFWHRGLSREEVLKDMANMDIGWAWRHSELETNTLELSTKILEYGSYGLPVILCGNEINENLLGSDYPLFANTYDELVALLNRLFDSPDILETASSRTRSASGKFTIDNIRKNCLRPLFNYPSSPEISIEHARRSSVLVAGHDFKFINRLCKEFSEHGYVVETDNWWGHSYHEAVSSQQLLEEAETIICEGCLGNAVWYSQNKRPGQKLIIRLHAQERFTKFPKRIVMDNVDKVIFVGPHIKRQAIYRFKWKRWQEKLTVIPNYVDFGLFDLPKKPGLQFNIGICGIVPMLKRFDRALDILEGLRRKDERFNLYVKGKMPHEYRWMQRRDKELQYYERLMARIENSTLLKDAVHFDGWGDDMPQWYQKIGFILSTSDSEGSHHIVAEGAAAKAVPILLKWEGAEEIYPKDWSYKNVDEATQAILNIVKSGNYDEIAQSWYNYVKENFTLGRVFSMWEHLLR